MVSECFTEIAEPFKEVMKMEKHVLSKLDTDCIIFNTKNVAILYFSACASSCALTNA